MDEATLVSRLAALQPPDAADAKRRAIDDVPPRIRPAEAGLSAHRSRIGFRLATASALCVVLLVAFSAFTAPGQALATWVGDRLGLGEPGGPPALQSLHRNAMRGTAGEGEPAYVLLRGDGPLGGHYEFITYRTSSQPGENFPAGGGDCFQLEFPESKNLFQAGCGLPSEEDGLLYAGVGGNSAPGASYQFASGRVSEDVAEVKFKVDGQELPVELKPVPPELIERFDLPRPFKFFIVFINPDLREGEVKVTARDAEGETVATRTEALIGPAELQP